MGRRAIHGGWRIPSSNQKSEIRNSLDPTVTKIILNGQNPTAADCFHALHRLQELKRATEPVWESIDFLLLPTTPTCYRIDEVQANPVELNSRLGTYTNFVNLLDLCAVTVPHGSQVGGVPTGPTLLAPAFHDDFLLQAAAVFLGDKLHSLKSEIKDQKSEIELAVVGAHLKGLPLHHQLVKLGARFLKLTRTAPTYKLYVLPDSTPPKPGMVRVNAGGASIEVETYALSPEAFGQFVAQIPSPLGIGTITLEEGETVKGFLCEPAALESAPEITAYGGWRGYLTYRESN
ncbi:MAG: amidase family protein [Candidatus Methylacidiphilales bacterium]|nr:amidase family protein [Candidatus Methylacidiphilales bacterium]